MTNQEPFIVFGAPTIEQAEIDEVLDCLQTGWLGTGPKVARFEEEFRKYKGAEHAVAVHSCTAALHLSMLAANLEPGDEVIAPALTFCATVNAIIHAGLKPVPADVDPVTMNLDPEDVARKITPKTGAIVPVHFAGRLCDMQALQNLADKENLKIIEDCAHAIEAESNGMKAGRFGDFGCFSFYVTKNVAAGEGGMVLCRDDQDAARIKMLALHGMSKDAWKRFGDEGYKHYSVVECGFKYNMMDLQAAIGLHQLERVESNWRKRERIWNRYLEAFKDLPVTLPAPVPHGQRHAYHLFTLLVDKKKTGISRDEFLDQMTGKAIGVGVHYLSLPEHPYYKETFGWQPEDCPHAMQIGRRTVSLPLSPGLTEKQVDRVIEAVKSLIV
jgi:dTDP-4-amino-4,6-dideoxygalactose transaminase